MKTLHIFYSWQSDISINDKFIQKSLEKAVKEINLTNKEINFVIDRDTANRQGTPDIPATIFSKIKDETDIFIADTTIINLAYKVAGDSLKLSPNPNVLMELGFAASSIGWENIICLMNTSFGRPELLPFDLKYRKPMEFQLSSVVNPHAKNKEKKMLTEDLKRTLLSLNPNESKYRLREVTNILISSQWESIGENQSDTKRWGTVNISKIVGNVFKFDYKRLPESGRDWYGTLYVSNDFCHAGRINWSFHDEKGYGLKEFFLEEDDKFYYMYLMHVKVGRENFDREVLRRKKLQ